MHQLETTSLCILHIVVIDAQEWSAKDKLVLGGL